MARFCDHHTIFLTFQHYFQWAEVQQLQLYHGCWISEALVRLLLWKQSLRWILNSAVTFAAVLLWFTDTVLFKVWQSLSLSFGFRPLFLLDDDVLPWFAYVIITLETAALETPNEVSILVTDAPPKCAPTMSSLKIWEFSHFALLSYKLLMKQSVMHWQWHYTTSTSKRIMKDTTNVLSVQPIQTVLFLYCLVFPLFVHSL